MAKRMTFPQFIRELRGEFTQAEFARALRVTDRTISNWELGIDAPCMLHLVALREEIGVDLNEMVDLIYPYDHRKSKEKDIREYYQRLSGSKR